MNVLNKCINKY